MLIFRGVTEVVRFIMQTITKRLAYIVTCSIKSEVNVVSVEVCQMSGNVVYQQEFEKPQIPTFSSLKKQVLAKLIDTTQHTIRLLVDNEEPSAKKKNLDEAWDEEIQAGMKHV